MSDEQLESLRRTLMWNRGTMVGIVVIIAWLMWMLIVEFRVMRHDFTELRVQMTKVADHVHLLEQFGGRALREHKLEAHDRAK